MRKGNGVEYPTVDARLASGAQAVAAHLGQALAWLRDGCADTIRSFQYARMIAVLSERTDAQLAVHNITRDEIPDYAAELIGYPRK